jgi:hypothetical protein
VIIDDCDRTLQFLEANVAARPGLTWTMTRRASEGGHPYARYRPGSFQFKASRSAFLRNLATRRASSDWIAFLDDDNELEADHLTSLLGHARQHGLRAVHSYASLWTPDGRPYLAERFPWERDPVAAERTYRALRERGVFTAGSNVVADRADPDGVEDPIRSVDTSEWLLDRRLLLEVGFDERYSDRDGAVIRGEDEKLLNRLIERRVPIGCTGRPTLRYTLGGYSNNFAGGEDASV